ncbi:MAG TPA: DNA gyrase inhibitor YacG [Myxococcaceae bacterium]|nr:DNA gyrase inhibitor YacG [Myxococcaceae bacterium]
MPRVRKCSICQKDVAPRNQNPSFPFCSPRCRSVDLGKWLGEEYRLPARSESESEDEVPSAPADGDLPDA